MAGVVGARKQTFIEAFTGGIEQAFPDGVAILGRAEREQSESGVSQAVLKGFLRKRLESNAAGREIYEIVFLQMRLACQPIILAQRERDMAGFIEQECLAFRGSNGTIFIDRVEVVAKHCAGNIQTLICKILHYKKEKK